MKKITALLLALAMLFTAAACATQGEQGGETPTPEATPTTAEIDLTEGGKWMNYEGANGDMNLRLPAYEFPSDTVTILNHYEINQPNSLKESVVRDVYKINYKTIVVDNGQKSSKLISMIMGGSAPDIAMISFTPALVNKGYAAAWDDYIDFSIGLWEGLSNSLNNISMNGKHYFIDATAQRHGSIVWVNTELFSEMGVKSPVEYYAEGNWTWDTMRECALNMTVDADGDGMPEIYGLANDNPQAFVHMTGIDFVTYNPDGTATNNILSDNIARAVEFHVSLYADGLVSEESDSRNTFVAGGIAMYMGPLWYRGSFLDMIHSGKVTLVPWPKDPQADAYYVLEEFGGHVLAKDASNPQGAAAYMTSTRYAAVNNLDNEYVSDEERYEKQQETNAVAEILKNELFAEDKTPVLQTWSSFNIGDFWGNIWFFTRLGEPWSSTAQELAPQIDSYIQTALEQ